ncbi:IS3 family transposase [Micromonospora sp. NPDC050276]|uniref:IS3 family transposase n=1 Tax=Micromonospora sp. NPDC050276 TaxID=3364278 RepID=UPI003790818B
MEKNLRISGGAGTVRTPAHPRAPAKSGTSCTDAVFPWPVHCRAADARVRPTRAAAGQVPRTTRPAAETGRPGDLVRRNFTAVRPNQLWVADLTYVRTSVGWVYAAFVLDVRSRMIVGWQVSTSLYTDLALDALKMAMWRRENQGADLGGLIHHSDRGVQYRAIRYSQRLAEAGAVASVGSKDDSYDNAMAEAFNSLHKAELVRNRGPWRGVNDLEMATVEYIDWYNNRRLHRELGHVPPAEYEALDAMTQSVTALLKTS